ncbi:type II secretion system protein GspD [Winogradskyella sp.]|uniref:type II secretion system protein GspD n=1 Tax=Winogradskyella sp. TaxID=1883156 RepID=UPI003AB1F4CB
MIRQLDSLEKFIPALSKKVNFNINNSEFPNFIRAIAVAHKLNVSVDPALKNIIVSQNFSNVTVKDVLIFSAQKFNLDIGFFGSIITISKKKIPVPKPRDIYIVYDDSKDSFTVDLQNDLLSTAFKKITNVTGKNLVFSPELANKRLSVYIKEMSFKSALDKLAFANNLHITKTKDNYYLFETNAQISPQKDKPQRVLRYKNANFYFTVKDTLNKILDVDFESISVESIINEIGMDLNLNLFTSFPLTEMKKTSFKASNISFDNLLNAVFEKDTIYSYKKVDDIYFFGKRTQTSLRSTVTIPLIHRSIEIMDEPINQDNSYLNNQNTKNQNQNNYANNRISQFNNGQNISTDKNFGQPKTKTEALLNVIPQEIRNQLEIKNDIEHNSFIVSGPAQQIEKFRKFLKLIDKPVPVVLIEVMILEVSKSASVSTGVTLGIGEQPTKTTGGIYPNTDITLNANAINKVIGGFNGFGSLNLGNVTPNFYAKIEALETNGDIDIKSTPKLATLNGHEATLSNGERTYYAITTTDIIGSQNPQTREIKNYVPVDANLSIKIKPLVSGNNQITLSIKVVQSNFNGKKIDPEAPPGTNSREFTSTLRVKDQDVIILGGLEENLKNDSGSGVPFLARVPIIKYLFSKRTRTNSKMKLSVLIKPTIIQ